MWLLTATYNSSSRGLISSSGLHKYCMNMYTCIYSGTDIHKININKVLNSFLSNFYLNSFSQQQKHSCNTCQLQLALLTHAWVRVIHGSPVTMLELTLVEKMNPPVPSSHRLSGGQLGVRAHMLLAVHAEGWLAWSLDRLGQTGTAAVSSRVQWSCHVQVTIVCFSLLDLWLLWSFCSPFSTVFHEPWGEGLQ